jgi:MarR family 2-MHQ and catechol resistance regulon transcriptional repressor
MKRFNVKRLAGNVPVHHNGSDEEACALEAYVKLVRAAESVTARLMPHLDAAGLTVSQFGALEALYHRGAMCQRDLGRKLLKSSGNITLVVDNLEKHGLVTRQRSTEDRRLIAVHLTDSGRELIERIFPDHARRIVAEMSVLSAAEQEELGRLCRAVGRGEPTASAVGDTPESEA